MSGFRCDEIASSGSSAGNARRRSRGTTIAPHQNATAPSSSARPVRAANRRTELPVMPQASTPCGDPPVPSIFGGCRAGERRGRRRSAIDISAHHRSQRMPPVIRPPERTTAGRSGRCAEFRPSSDSFEKSVESVRDTIGHSWKRPDSPSITPNRKRRLPTLSVPPRKQLHRAVGAARLRLSNQTELNPGPPAELALRRDYFVLLLRSLFG